MICKNNIKLISKDLLLKKCIMYNYFNFSFFIVHFSLFIKKGVKKRLIPNS